MCLCLLVWVCWEVFVGVVFFLFGMGYGVFLGEEGLGYVVVVGLGDLVVW